MCQSFRGSRYGCEPELLDAVNNFKKLIEVRRLHDVAIRVKIVARNNIFFGA